MFKNDQDDTEGENDTTENSGNQNTAVAGSSTPPDAGPATVHTVGPHDVLMGRGARQTDNAGNTRLRERVARCHAVYARATRRHEKHRIAVTIVQEVLARGGRFLRQVNNDDDAASSPSYVVVEDRPQLYTKVKQLLRDMGPESLERRAERQRYRYRKLGQPRSADGTARADASPDTTGGTREKTPDDTTDEAASPSIPNESTTIASNPVQDTHPYPPVAVSSSTGIYGGYPGGPASLPTSSLSSTMPNPTLPVGHNSLQPIRGSRVHQQSSMDARISFLRELQLLSQLNHSLGSSTGSLSVPHHASFRPSWATYIPPGSFQHNIPFLSDASLFTTVANPLVAASLRPPTFSSREGTLPVHPHQNLTHPQHAGSGRSSLNSLPISGNARPGERLGVQQRQRRQRPTLRNPPPPARRPGDDDHAPGGRGDTRVTASTTTATSTDETDDDGKTAE